MTQTQAQSVSPAPPAIAWRVSWSPAQITAGSALLIAFFGLFYRWFAQQAVLSWNALDDWGHVFVVPIFTGYMLWKRREELARTRPEVFWAGIVPLVLGVACYFYFVLGVRNHMLQGASLLLTLGGLCLLLLGTRMFERIFLPLSYLVFAITLADQIMTKMTFPLQLIATKGAWLLLKIISLPGTWFIVEARGNVLEMTYNGVTTPLNVAEACSGMRMVIAFVALSAAVAIVSSPQWWQRTALVALSVPVAVLMNVVRVAVLALASLLNVDLAAGNAHMVIGTLLLVPGLFLFLLVDKALKRIFIESPAGGNA